MSRSNRLTVLAENTRVVSSQVIDLLKQKPIDTDLQATLLDQALEIYDELDAMDFDDLTADQLQFLIATIEMADGVIDALDRDLT